MFQSGPSANPAHVQPLPLVFRLRYCREDTPASVAFRIVGRSRSIGQCEDVEDVILASRDKESMYYGGGEGSRRRPRSNTRTFAPL